MATRELIRAEVDRVPDERLGELYDLVRRFQAPPAPPAGGVLSKLRAVSIDAPADFAANLDAYTAGEKHVEDVP